MPDSAVPALPPGGEVSEAFVHTRPDVALTGFILFRPVYAAAGTIIDPAYEYLNPAAQQMLRLAPRRC